MPVEPIPTPSAPATAGPYSPAVRAGDWIVLAGQGAFDVEGVEAQTRQTFANIKAILGDCGAGVADIAKTTVYLADMDDFAAMNAVYAEEMGDHKPARTTIQAARLPFDIRVEIEVWAYKPAG
jgi:2-iminobutanoate/2-iminopropanoate deaminase